MYAVFFAKYWGTTMAQSNKHMEDKNYKKKASKFKQILSGFFKIATALLLCLIVALICIDFFDTTKSYLSYEIIVCLCLVLIITCLDSFDCFQLGNILRLEKEKKSIEEDNKHLREQNNMLCSMVSNINNNIYIDSTRVVPADDKNDLDDRNSVSINTYEPNDESTGNLERELLLNYIKINNYQGATIIWEPKIESLTFPRLQERLFDLYIKQRDVEQFIEVKYLVPTLDNLRYIDMQISAVENYNRNNYRSAQYVLLLCKKMFEGENTIVQINRKKYNDLLSKYKRYIDSGMMIVEIM